ncbi:MAG TPA: polysaccharide biosynthesis/export family protein [Steroidobacteraceae bacterium]
MVLLLVGLILVGARGMAADTAPTDGYKLQPGDLLQVVVWKETDLQSEVLIRPDGGISFALAGDMQAAGRTTDELRAELESRVRKLVPGAVVTVSVKAANGNRVFVIGKVNRPGDFALNRPIDVMQAISLAGGVTPFASADRIRVLHREGTKQNSIRFRYSEVAKGRNLAQNVLLQSGDTVIVP